MSKAKEEAIDYCIGMLGCVTDAGFESVMQGEFNDMFDHAKDLPALLEAAKGLTVDEMMANPDIQKELRSLCEGLQSSVKDSVEYLIEG